MERKVKFTCYLLHLFHRQLHPPPLPIHLHHFHHYLLPQADHIRRVLDEFVGQLRDVHQPALLDADVHKSAEVGDVVDDTRHHHADLQVFDRLYFGELERSGGAARVQAGLLQFL